MNKRIGLVSLLLFGILVEATVHAADHSAIMPFVADEVVAVGYLDLTAIDISAALQEMRDLGALPPDESDAVAGGLMMAQRWVNELVGSGATRAYVLLRTSDLPDMGPTWVLSLTDKADPDAVVRLIADLFKKSDRPALFPHEFQIVDGAILAAMNKAQLERLATRRVEQPREKVMTALTELGDGSAGLIVLGDADSRRVLREMFPAMPAPFHAIDGRMIANDLLWGGVAVDLPPKLKLTIHVETTGGQVAETLRRSAVKALELTELQLKARLADAPAPLPADAIPQAIEALKPRIDGAAVKLTLGTDAKKFARLRDVYTLPMVTARERAQRSRRINQFKQLALAFVNYESLHGTFVEQANYDEEGRPLLSWRVHLLPYMDQQALYAEFHLHEPWDSAHNRQLIERMPEIYSDPSAAVRRAVGAGRTTFVAPVAAETLFPPRKGQPGEAPLKIRDVKDGISKTILFVEVAPERAVVWTKPEDWNVDLDRPLQGVKRTGRSGFIAAFCDGHVTFLSNDVDTQKLLAQLTRAGGEPVD